MPTPRSHFRSPLCVVTTIFKSSWITHQYQLIGHAILNTKDDALILDDVSEGVALFKMGGTERVKTFEVPHRECRSRNVAFLDGTSTIVSGSDHGAIYMFDRRTGEVTDRIHVGIRDWVQSISTIECSGVPLIFVGLSGENVKRPEIQIWERVVTTPRETPTQINIWEEVHWIVIGDPVWIIRLGEYLGIPGPKLWTSVDDSNF
ncbi:hypothetical protein C8R42DRAFT_644612 [Lentinula raphanica]|nr:hypothetical protein C8R42DRAFT_644612 [Lentinula raphanica]